MTATTVDDDGRPLRLRNRVRTPTSPSSNQKPTCYESRRRPQLPSRGPYELSTFIRTLLGTYTRTPTPGFNCALADSRTELDEVVSVNDLRMPAATLATDFAREQREIKEKIRRGESKWGGGTWAHGQLDAFLSAWAAWLEDTRLKPLPALMVKHGIKRQPVEPVTWQSIAVQLRGARSMSSVDLGMAFLGAVRMAVAVRESRSFVLAALRALHLDILLPDGGPGTCRGRARCARQPATCCWARVWTSR